MGDSIIKYVKCCTKSSSLDKWKVYVKDFPGASARCMQDFARPTLRENYDHIIIDVGTNDLALNTPAEKVAELFIYLASTLKSNSCSVAIFSITVKNNKHRNRVPQVNLSSKSLSQKKKI